MNSLIVLGAISVGALAASAAYLVHLLRALPLSRRLLNLLMPTSQIAFVVCAYSLRPYFAHWQTMALSAALMGIACAALNPLFFRTLLAAERADREAERAELLEGQIAAQKHYDLLMRRMHDEADQVRADLDRELAGIECALAAGDTDALQAHLNGATFAVRTPEVLRCAHPVVAALLNAKAVWCTDQHIELSISAEVPVGLSTPDVELCALFANALDNAIHAASALPEGERWIKLSAHPEQEYFLLEVENGCELQHAGESAQRQRAAAPGALPRHGLGLAIMREIVERHDGSLTCTRDGDTYCLSAIWKL